MSARETKAQIDELEAQLREAERWLPLLRQAETTIHLSSDRYRKPEMLRAIQHGEKGGILPHQTIRAGTEDVSFAGTPQRVPTFHSDPSLRRAQTLLADWSGRPGALECEQRLTAIPPQLEALRERLPTPEEIAAAEARASDLATAASQAADRYNSALLEALNVLAAAGAMVSEAESELRAWSAAHGEWSRLAGTFELDATVPAPPRSFEAPAALRQLEASLEAGTVAAPTATTSRATAAAA